MELLVINIALVNFFQIQQQTLVIAAILVAKPVLMKLIQHAVYAQQLTIWELLVLLNREVVI